MATNAFAAFIEGQQAGQQARAYQQQQEDRNALRTLAPKILAGDPDAFNQAAAIDPKAATAVQDAGDGQLRRLRGALDYFGQALESGDDRVIQARFKEISPFLSRVTGNEAPPAWTEEMRPAFEQARQRVAMAAAGGSTGNNIQSTYVDADGNRVAIFRDGTSRVLGANNQSIRVLEPEGAVPYGVVTSGGRAGQMVNIGGGQPQPQGAQATPQHDEQAAQRAQSYYQRMRAIGLTDEQAVAATDALLADMGYQQGQPATSPAAPSSNGPAASTGRLLVPDMVHGGLQPPRTPTSAEKAAATEAAKLGVQLEYAPRIAAAEADAARQRAEAEAAVKGNQQRAERDATLRLYETAMEGLREGLSATDTGPVVGRIPAFTTGQQIAEGAVAAMAPVLKQLFRAAGEGTFTDKDQELLLRMVPTRTDTQEAARAKVDNIDRIVRAKLGQPVPAAGNGRGASGPTPGTVEDGYRFRGGDPSDPRNWERL